MNTAWSHDVDEVFGTHAVVYTATGASFTLDRIVGDFPIDANGVAEPAPRARTRRARRLDHRGIAGQGLDL
jgi:hypothetical protein